MERKSITLPDGTLESGLTNARKRGFANSFSAYVAWLIERDAAGNVPRETLPSVAEDESDYQIAAKRKQTGDPLAKAGRQMKRVIKARKSARKQSDAA